VRTTRQAPHRTLRAATVAAVLATGLLGLPALAQVPNAPVEPTTTAAELAPVDNSAFSGTELRRSRSAQGDAARDARAETEPAAPSSGFGLVRVLVSLGIVVGIILLLKHFGQRWFVPGTVKGSNRTVETLSRTIISPRQQVLLIRVGRRRVLVVGDSGGKLSQLDQITDADEIAELTAQLRTEKTGPAATAFAGVFGKSAEKFEADTVANQNMGNVEPVNSSVTETHSDLAGLLEKVRGVSSRLGR
jgi:flagellar biogenesis protein FliO